MERIHSMLYENWTSHSINIYISRTVTIGSEEGVWCELAFIRDKNE